MDRNIYLERYAHHPVGLSEQIKGDPEMIIVIPAHREASIERALESLKLCLEPPSEVAILIVVNESVNAEASTSQINQQCIQAIERFQTTYQQIVSYQKLPQKKAGVGLARKIGMDEALRFFESQGKDGIIICYDADCACDRNYLQEIYSFYQNPKNLVGLIHYEHELAGINHEAIINYELHLRYYINALRYSQYPYALQTLGSCITVRASAYQKQGGMNTRKAGEDFYFIHKMTPLGGIGEINNTTIYPSDRVSDRVPFGTGHAVNKYLENPNHSYPTYNPRIFEDLRWVNEDLEKWYSNGNERIEHAPGSLNAFFDALGFQKDFEQIINQSGSFENFKMRYYRWWDGFKVLKFVHFARDHFYPNLQIDDCLNWLAANYSLVQNANSREERLKELRVFDKNQHFTTNDTGL